MKKITVELVDKPAIDPKIMIGGLARLTQVKKSFEFSSPERGAKIIDSISTKGHTTLLEPVNFGFIVHGASRVFLSQIRTHRHCTFVSQSHQYQDQACFPYVLLPELVELTDLALAYHDFMKAGERLYRLMKASGIPQDQARYVIPPAARNDLFIGANARQLVEVMFPQRICRRNTLETRYVMSKMLNILLAEGFDCIFKHTGPACVTRGKCDQGNMTCGRPFKSFEEMLDEENI